MTAVVYWRDNFEAALKEAKEANHPLVLELYMEGCPHCAAAAPGDPWRPGGGRGA